MNKLEQKLLNVLAGKSEKPLPIWMMRQAGRHLPEYLELRAQAKGFIDFCFSPGLASEATLQPIRRYNMDAAILFADILLVPIALGRNVHFVKGSGPVLDPMTVKDVAGLKSDLSRLDPVYETVSRVRGELGVEKSLIGFCGGPWTVATYMIEGRGTPHKETAKRFAYENPKAMDALLKALSEASADYLIRQAEAGADALKIFESWAEGLAPPLFERLVIKPTRAIIDRIRAAGITQPVIGFPRGSGLNAFDYAKKSGVTAIAAGTDVPLQRFRQGLPKNMPTQGNLDPLALRIGGDSLRRAVQSVLDSVKGPHIFNLGHGVAPDVKIENVHAVVSHVRTGFGNYV